jgi:acetyltransferase-like isoleucine patch superfamily enzyme
VTRPGASRAWRLRYLHGPRLASRVRRRAALAWHPHADVDIALPVRLGPGFSLWIPEPATFRTGPACDFRRGFVCEVGPGGVVDIADNCVFTSHTLIQISTSLTIGSGASFGQSLMIVDGNHRFRDTTRSPLEQGYDFRPITIGAKAMVLSKVTLLASVGEGAVIGAGSVVTRDIPPYSVAVGAPARVIERFGPDGDDA